MKCKTWRKAAKATGWRENHPSFSEDGGGRSTSMRPESYWWAARWKQPRKVNIAPRMKAKCLSYGHYSNLYLPILDKTTGKSMQEPSDVELKANTTSAEAKDTAF